MGWQVAQVKGVDRVADIDERGAVAAAHDGVFFAVKRVCPAPYIVAIAAAHLVEG